MYLVYLDKVQQPSESPGNRIEPFRPGVGPLRVNQLGKVPISKVAVSDARGEVLLGDVAGREVAETEEVACTLDITLILRGEDGQTRGSEALLTALPT